MEEDKLKGEVQPQDMEQILDPDYFKMTVNYVETNSGIYYAPPYLNAEESKQLFLDYKTTVELHKLGYNSPNLGVIYSDQQVMTGSYAFSEIMLRKDKDCVGAILLDQAIEFLNKTYFMDIGLFIDRDIDTKQRLYQAAVYYFINGIELIHTLRDEKGIKVFTDRRTAMVEAIQLGIKIVQEIQELGLKKQTTL